MLTPRLEIRQRQALVMTPQLLQSVKLLQMSSAELADFVAEQVESNPLLEFTPRAASASTSAPRSGATGGDAAEALQAVAAEVTLWQHLHAQIGAMRLKPAQVQAALLLADELEEDGYLREPLDEVAVRHDLTRT